MTHLKSMKTASQNHPGFTDLLPVYKKFNRIWKFYFQISGPKTHT